jgi:hypothetical protein
MFQQQLQFLKNEAPMLISSLQANVKPNWGNMSAQHMIEHLGLSLMVSNGVKQVTKLFTPEENIPAMQQFILSDKAFKENTKSPALPETPLPLHYKTIEEAKENAIIQLQKVFELYEANDNVTTLHPAFGNLNYELQVALLYKHLTHHFRQFSLI